VKTERSFQPNLNENSLESREVLSTTSHLAALHGHPALHGHAATPVVTNPLARFMAGNQFNASSLTFPRGFPGDTGVTAPNTSVTGAPAKILTGPVNNWVIAR
jgi:hypothetical protein